MILDRHKRILPHLILNIQILLLCGCIKICKYVKIALQESYFPHERTFCKSQTGRDVKLFSGISTPTAARKYRLCNTWVKFCGFHVHQPPALDKFLLRCEAAYSSSSISMGISKNLCTRLYGVTSH